ncbi:MAG: formylglycine-generating enzyme family protein [Spirochaetes bacterium]|nr:formylglycine-generating enzyme family protein [Spirochaetota bacterium]
MKKSFCFKIISPIIILLSALILTAGGGDSKDLKIEMVYIKAGTFMMGSLVTEPGRYDDETQHQVILTNGFYMSKFQVTQKLWKQVMWINPSKFKGDNLPVENVSWYDAIVFCNKLSIKEGFKPVYSISENINPDEWGPTPVDKLKAWDDVVMINGANGYRLPTEAEWEYACRAGTASAFNWGTDNITADQANFNAYYPIGSSELYNNSMPGKYKGKTIQVGTFKPAWGLYDMHGNVYEWCWDWYGADYYSAGPSSDPNGPASGDFRIMRGGSWFSNGQYLRSAYRNYSAPSNKTGYIGFRVARS